MVWRVNGGRIDRVTDNPREKDLDGHFLGGTIAITKESHSNEPLLMATINNAPGGLVPRPIGLIGFEGLPTGLNPAGGASTFTADFGYDGFDTTATVSFADLAAPTIDDLLVTMFNRLDAALPIGLAADLTLDLANQMISFEFPFGKTNYFVNVFSTDIGNGDTGVGAIGGLVEVPEPAPLAALVLAATAMLMRRRARA